MEYVLMVAVGLLGGAAGWFLVDAFVKPKIVAKPVCEKKPRKSRAKSDSLIH